MSYNNQKLSSRRIRCVKCGSSDGFAPSVNQNEYGFCFACHSTHSPNNKAEQRDGYKPPEQKQEPEFTRKYLNPEILSEFPSVENSKFGAFYGKLFGDSFLQFCHECGVRSDSAGYTVFPFFDLNGNLCGLKSILYRDDGKRDRDNKYSILSGYNKTATSTEYLTKQNGFQLCNYNEIALQSERKVLVFESEKTALITQFFYRDYSCVATRSANITAACARVFQGKKIFILPDNDTAGIQGAERSVKILNTLPNTRASVLDYFLSELNQKDDLADLIIKFLIDMKGVNNFDKY